MQLISTLALAASASALVAQVAPKASTARKGATLDDQLKKIPGVSPLKNAPADYGFDPLGFAKVSYPRFGLPADDVLRTNNLRDAELRHGRLAMLAAAAWPIQELVHPSLAKMAGAPELLSDGRSPSILNGGLVAGPVPAFLLATAAAIGYLDVQAEAKKAEYPAEDWIPGLGAVSLEMPYISPERHRRGAQMDDRCPRRYYGFDPLNLVGGMSPLAIKNMQARFGVRNTLHAVDAPARRLPHAGQGDQQWPTRYGRRRRVRRPGGHDGRARDLRERAVLHAHHLLPVGPAPPHGRVRHRILPLLGSPPLSRCKCPLSLLDERGRARPVALTLARAALRVVVTVATPTPRRRSRGRRHTAGCPRGPSRCGAGASASA